MQDDVFAFEENNFKQRHLWTTDLDGKTKRITEGDWSVSSYELSADGTRIAMHAHAEPAARVHRIAREVWVMDANGVEREAAHDQQGARGQRRRSRRTARRCCSRRGSNEQFDIYYNDKLFLVPAAGGAARVLLPDVAYEVENASWSKDGKSIYFTANMGVHNEIMRVDVGDAGR